MMGSTVTSQALLSGSNLVVGLFLIRYTSDLQYGYYILASSTLVLLTSMHGAFFHPPLAIRLNTLDGVGRSDFVGGIYRGQRQLLWVLGGAALCVVALLWYSKVVTEQITLLVLVTVTAARVGMGSHETQGAVNRRSRFLAFAKMMGSTVTSQALLSGSNLVVGLFLIRYTSDLQYGYYILASSALILLTSMHGAFFHPPLAIRLNTLDGVGRSDFVGGIYRGQRQLLWVLGGAALCLVALL
ncbi:MAG: hypothetical protein H7Y02_02915, partial [Candidatus Obscuribacterales bacterium]|nr:hypothetical protein [Steroidobacteraceae bacterium]